jgi:hypothetical protein
MLQTLVDVTGDYLPENKLIIFNMIKKLIENKDELCGKYRLKYLFDEYMNDGYLSNSDMTIPDLKKFMK